MRFLTYNIHGWKGSDNLIDVARLARIIAASQASVVGLNEVFHPLLPPGESRPALERLADLLGMDFAFGMALTPPLAFSSQPSYGNALLSRYPLLAHAGHHLTAIEGHEQRGLLETRLSLPDGREVLSVYVSHLDHRSELVRLKQLSAVKQWTARDRSRPHLLMGDFNALAPADYAERPGDLDSLREDAALEHLVRDGQQVIPQILRSQYVDAAVGQGRSHGATYPAGDPSIRIDYIFASQPLAQEVRWCQAWHTEDTSLASDHLPVLAELSL